MDPHANCAHVVKLDVILSHSFQRHFNCCTKYERRNVIRKPIYSASILGTSLDVTGLGIFDGMVNFSVGMTSHCWVRVEVTAAVADGATDTSRDKKHLPVLRGLCKQNSLPLNRCLITWLVFSWNVREDSVHAIM